ncbi:putative cytochrome b5 family protein [Lyophyllum shimeji]|uniref:Cytochrome b5 family protein n=1 Tax=Lyophyllum shimeji TaxID=47721 RepID=A0A9P3UHJ4_LYOSH|nr:putative cytochrome b5 family protein [Lyophyllum shimeji]
MATKTITIDDLRAHKTKESLYLLIHGKVYDVSKFIDEHPGGDEVLLAEGGQDATEAFEDVGHSDEARALLPGMLVGEFEGGAKLKSGAAEAQSKRVSNAVEQGSNMMYFLPLGLLGAYFAWRYYTGSA